MIKSNSGKDIRDLIYLDQPMFIIFDDYTHYSIFCKYTKDIIDIMGYVTLRDVLEHVNYETDFQSAYMYGYTSKTINHALAHAELHKFKRNYKTDGTWPICVTLPTPINIFENKLYERRNYESNS